jgi:NitT/TauT family transport system ATP-binding protein
MQADAFLEVRNVSKSFRHGRQKTGRMLALSDVSFTMAEGTFLSIIGPSGCGKSTLLRLIDGLQQPDSGEILIDGNRVDRPGRDRGLVFQAPNLMPWRTALRNVTFGLEAQGIHGAERTRRARALLELVGLSEFEDFYPSQLSGGMQQRVGLARALAVNPSVLLMDEPFAAVDAQTKLVLQEELERIWLMEEKSVVFITHDVDEALFLSDTVLVMSKSPGKIIDTVHVDFPRPRSFDIRGSVEFAALVRRLLDSLRHRQPTEDSSWAARSISSKEGPHDGESARVSGPGNVGDGSR